MSKQSFTLMFIVLCLNAISQQITISGVVSLANSKFKTGIRKYISNAFVEDSFKIAQPDITKGNGDFKLIYVGLHEGSRVYFKVHKPNSNLEVLNIASLQAVLGQSDKIYIDMAPANEIAERRSILYEVSKTKAEKSLENLILQKNNKIKTLQKVKSKNEIEIEELRNQLAILESQKGEIEQQAQALATRYSVVNLDDASKEYINAYNLFQNGYLDSALITLSNADLPNQVDKIIAEESKIENLRKETNIRDSIRQVRKEQTFQSLHLQADLFVTKYVFDSAFSTYRNMIKLKPNSSETFLEYAILLNAQQEYDSSIYNFQRLLSITQSDKMLISGLNGVGKVFFEMKNYKSADSSFKAALHLIEIKSTNEQRAFFWEHLISIRNIATVYHVRGFYDSAQHYYDQVVSNLNECIKCIPADDYFMFLNTLGNIAGLYATKNFYDTSIGIYKHAIALTLTVSFGPILQEEYLYTLFNLNYGLGTAYQKSEQIDSAKLYYQKALGYGLELSSINPKPYEYMLFETYTNLSQVVERKSKQAYDYNLKALNIVKNLANSNAQIYTLDYVVELANIGSYFNEKKSPDSAKKYIYQALEKATIYDFSKSVNYGNTMFLIYSNLGKVYRLLNNFDSAKCFFTQAIKCLSDTGLNDKFKVYNEMALLYSSNNNPMLGITFLNRSTGLLKNLILVDSSRYYWYYGEACCALARLFQNMNLIDSAKVFYDIGLPILEKYAYIFPGRYKLEYALRLWHSAVVNMQAHDYASAEIKNKDAKTIYEETLSADELASSLDYITLTMNLGLTHYLQSEFDSAEFYLQIALKFTESIQNMSLDYLEVAAQVNQNLGTLYLNMNCNNETKKYYRKALNYLLQISKEKPGTDLEYIKRLQNYLHANE